MINTVSYSLSQSIGYLLYGAETYVLSDNLIVMWRRTLSQTQVVHSLAYDFLGGRQVFVPFAW